MTYYVTTLNDRLQTIKSQSKSVLETHELIETYLMNLSDRLSHSDNLVICGDLTAIRYLPKYFNCKVSIVIERDSLTSYYSSRWQYMQQGYSRVYNKSSYYNNACTRMII